MVDARPAPAQRRGRNADAVAADLRRTRTSIGTDAITIWTKIAAAAIIGWLGQVTMRSGSRRRADRRPGSLTALMSRVTRGFGDELKRSRIPIRQE